MENNSRANGILDTTIDKIRLMADADVVIGDKIVVDANVTLIPVSKVSYGFASGGTDFGGKVNSTNFGGGGGGGISITPVAFVVVNNGNVKVLNINPAETALDKAITMIPELFDKVMGKVKSEKTEEE